MLRVLALTGTLALLACGTDAFSGDGGPDATADAADEMTEPDASVGDATIDVTNMEDAGIADAIVLTDAACTDMCVACIQSKCGTQVLLCDNTLDPTCTKILQDFVTCRCAGEGGTCDGILSTSSNGSAKSVVSCAHNNCPPCGF